MHKNVLVSKT